MAHRRFKSWLTGIVKSDPSSRNDARKSPMIPDGSPTPENITMMQGFEWYVPADQKHWKRLQAEIPQLKAWGIDNIWIPPACKAATQGSNGYDIYDLYDLGEFDQKSGLATKWGTKDELVDFCNAAKQQNVGIYFDAVLNHRFGGDRTEKCKAIEVHPQNRNRMVSKPYEIDAWVGYDFPGRGDKYSKQKYHWNHFSGVDYDNNTKKVAIYNILREHSKGWAKKGDVDDEMGNYDYLMGCNLDYSNPEVETDVLAWGKWLAETVPLNGMRFDAIKHFSAKFLAKFVKQMEDTCGDDWFSVGEFWKDEVKDMCKYLKGVSSRFCLFDAPLVHNFSIIGARKGSDLRGVFDGTLTQCKPDNSVTIVMNHDTQPTQSLELPITDWFKPLAHALILLREQGYPCVWYGDIYGIKGEEEFAPSCGGVLHRFTLARKLYAYGEQIDYFDHPTCIGWVRYGTHDRHAGMAVLMSSDDADHKRMHVGEMHAGQEWTDVLGWSDQPVVIGRDGYGDFTAGQCSVSVWVRSDAPGREMFEKKFNANIYDD